MKKLFIFCLASAAISAGAQLQVQVTPQGAPRSFAAETSPADMPVSVNDTLHYFYNKHFFRNTYNGTQTSPNGQFYGLYAPYTNSAQVITHCGGIFLNTTPVQVVGLEGAVFRHATAQSQSVTIRLYLCNLTGGLQPILPPLDSITTAVGPTPNGFVFVGGTFTAPITVTGNFAVLFRNASTNPLDTVRLIMNNAATSSATVPVQQRYGEGMGRLRLNGNFLTNAFGATTDYEFIVAPRVSFSFTAGAVAITQTVCTNGTGSFSNTSGPSVLENRQFNFNQFYKRWSPWSLTTNSLISLVNPDSVYVWNFTGSPSTNSFAKHPSVTFNTAGVQNASLTANYRQTANLGNQLSLSEVVTETIGVTSAAGPVIAISGPTAICSGNSATLIASGNTTFTWTNPATTSPSIIVNPNTTTIYTVSADNNGCLSTRTVQLVVSNPPNLNLSAPASVCKGKVFVLSATGANSYSWSTSATTASISAVSNTPGTVSYTVVGTNNGCPPAQGIANVQVNDLPIVSIASQTNLVCSKATGGSSITLTGAPSGGVYTGIGVTSGFFTPNNTGIFVATYSYTDATTSCASTATTAITVTNCIVNPVDVASYQLNQNLAIYPNPSASGVLNLRNLDGVNVIQVFNILGVQVIRQTSERSEHAVDLSVYPQGHYLVKVTDANGKAKMLKVVYHN
jgi:hypothetical protein